MRGRVGCGGEEVVHELAWLALERRGRVSRVFIFNFPIL